MKFSRRKLPKLAIKTLRRVPTELCKAHAILLTPVYAYLIKNEKFVALKGPLQFFTPDELEKFKTYENFFIPEFIDQVAPFQKAGESIRRFLTVQQKRSVQTNQGKESILLPAPQHEIDNALLSMVGKLWNEGPAIEPFFLCFFANEICPPIPVEKMMDASATDVDCFELALLRSSAAVFLALHIGNTDIKMLSLLRNLVFENTLDSDAAIDSSGEMRQMIQLVHEVIPDIDAREVSLERIQEIIESPSAKLSGRVAKKLHGRLMHLKEKFVSEESLGSSLFGEEGLIDN